MRQDRFGSKLDAVRFKIEAEMEQEENQSLVVELNESSIRSDEYTMNTLNNPYSLHKADFNRVKDLDKALSMSLLESHCRTTGAKSNTYKYKK